MTLTLVPAGAGAGKTTRIERTLTEWVAEGHVAAGRILAVTFTDAAASELRGRIRGALIRAGRVEDALDLDRAYVGTIHSLGQRLLTEHAFAAGRSPASRLLSEAERDLLIRRLIPRACALAPVMEHVARFGYTWDFLTEQTGEDRFRERVQSVVDLLRGFGRQGTSPDILAPALAALRAGYGMPAPDGAALTDGVRQAAQTLLSAFPDGLAGTTDKTSVRATFLKDHRAVKRAAETDALGHDWKLWQSLRALRLSKKGAPTPEGYDALAQAVMAAADALPRHPGPLNDAETHLTALVRGAQEILTDYDAAKRRAGLIDYSDMIAEAERLLRTRRGIRDAVLAEIDCVVIDEFQDTNPVQFALLWQLARGAKRALIVGDAKQSIMGFQGADARLSQALHAAHPAAVDPLSRNWRSVPPIMALVNAAGPALFPEGYDPLTPQRGETGATALEMLLLPGGRPDPWAECIADRIATLLEEAPRIEDRQTKALRPLDPSDIAVLCYTHDKAAKLAEALRARAQPVRIRGNGWLDAPATRAARAALAFVADPDDLHAALRFLVLGPPAHPLQEALLSAVDRVWPTHVALAPLAALHSQAETLPVADLLAKTIHAAGLRDWAAALPEGAQAMADLTRLEAEARAFDAMGADLRAAAGFHGAGPQVFLGWIAAQTERGWDLHPDPDGWTGAGIEIATWHAAKGREWPVVVVAGLDHKIAERPGTLRAEFAGFDDLDRVLDRAGLGWLPDFAAPEVQERFADERQEDEERGAARALYVALTRARDRLILALPPAKDADRPERIVDLLRARTGLATGDGTLTVCGTELTARIVPFAKGIEFPEEAETAPAPHPRFGRQRAAPDAPRTPWRQSPSAPGLPAEAVALTHHALGPKLGAGLDGHARATDRGSAWHLAFRTLATRPDLAECLPAATCLPVRSLETIAEQVRALTGWLALQGYDRLHVELPFQQTTQSGAQVNGIVDLLAEGPAGALILDHKSGACPDPEARFASYLPQLRAYAALVEAERGVTVRGLAIHWMSEGTLSLAPHPARVRA